MYSGNYTPTDHFHPSGVSDFTFGTPTGVKDGMFTVKTADN